MEPQLPPEIPGMKTVDKDTFYRVIDSQNVHPHIEGRWHETFGYRSDWLTPERKLVGVSISGSPPFSLPRYMLPA